jgi:hypothetical protein
MNALKKFMLVLVFTLALFTFRYYSVKAETEPPWRDQLDCKEHKYQGFDFCTSKDGKTKIAIVDLSEENLRFEYLIAEGKDRFGNIGPCMDVNIPRWSTGVGCSDLANQDFYPVMSLYNAVDRSPNATVIINSDYGAGTQNSPDFRGHGPEGFVVVQGKRIDGPQVGDPDNNAVKRPWLAIGYNPLNVELGQFEVDDGTKPDWINVAVGGAPWLIRDGEIRTGDIQACTNANPHSCASKVAQTAIGISSDERRLFVVVMIGGDAQDIAVYMKNALNVTDAIKFDGGGSSQMYYAGLPGDTVQSKVVYRGDGRWLSQYLAIIAQPMGEAADDDSDQKEELGFFEQLWKSISGWVDNLINDLRKTTQAWADQQMKNVQKSIEKLLQSLTQDLLNWLQRVLDETVTQVCGSIVLPILFMFGRKILQSHQSI